MDRISFLNTYIDNLTMAEAVEEAQHLIEKKENSYIVTPNLDHIVILEKDKEFAEIYANADLILADGKPLIWISKMLKNPIKEKISGSDFFPQLCRHLKEYGVSLGISIGATIDFEAGNVKRAPKWMADHGLEWLFRITQDPKRLIKRYWNDAVNIVPIIRKYKNKG